MLVKTSSGYVFSALFSVEASSACSIIESGAQKFQNFLAGSGLFANLVVRLEQVAMR